MFQHIMWNRHVFLKKLLTNIKKYGKLTLPLLESFFVMLKKGILKLHVEGGKTFIFTGRCRNESENHTRLQRMQTKKLRHYQEQEERSRSSRVQQVLPFLP